MGGGIPDHHALYQGIIKPGDSMLEIGSGTGRYSHALARQGYAVDAAELVAHNINHTLPGEKITITQGNALDLSVFSDNTYDMTYFKSKAAIVESAHITSMTHLSINKRTQAR